MVTGCPTCHKAILENEFHSCPGLWKAERPPLGVMPRFIWKEKRFNDIREAIIRYSEKGIKIPPEWIEEYNELVRGGD